MRKETIRQIIILGIIGFVAGVAISVGFGWGMILNVANGTLPFGKLAGFLALGGLNGTICMGATVIYNIESWSLLKCTVTHFVIAMSSFFTMAFLQGWMSFKEVYCYYVIAGTLVAYAIIWFIMYSKYNREVRKLNEELRKMKSEEKKE